MESIFRAIANPELDFLLLGITIILAGVISIASITPWRKKATNFDKDLRIACVCLIVAWVVIVSYMIIRYYYR